jgi:hypothetical protein
VRKASQIAEGIMRKLLFKVAIKKEVLLNSPWLILLLMEKTLKMVLI